MKTLEQQLNKERDKTTEVKLKNEQLIKQIDSISDSLSEQNQKVTDYEDKIAQQQTQYEIRIQELE